MAGVKGLLAVIFLLAASKAAFAAIGNPPYVIGKRWHMYIFEVRDGSFTDICL